MKAAFLPSDGQSFAPVFLSLSAIGSAVSSFKSPNIYGKKPQGRERFSTAEWRWSQ